MIMIDDGGGGGGGAAAADDDDNGDDADHALSRHTAVCVIGAYLQSS